MARCTKAPSTVRLRSPGQGGSGRRIRVALVSGPDFHPEYPPVRRMLVSPDQTLAGVRRCYRCGPRQVDHSYTLVRT